MMATVRDFFEYLNSVAPVETQEEWDNSGMLVGDMNAEVSKAVVVLDIDITPSVIEQVKPYVSSTLKISPIVSPFSVS